MAIVLRKGQCLQEMVEFPRYSEDGWLISLVERLVLLNTQRREWKGMAVLPDVVTTQSPNVRRLLRWLQ